MVSRDLQFCETNGELGMLNDTVNKDGTETTNPRRLILERERDSINDFSSLCNDTVV